MLCLCVKHSSNYAFSHKNIQSILATDQIEHTYVKFLTLFIGTEAIRLAVKKKLERMEKGENWTLLIPLHSACGLQPHSCEQRKWKKSTYNAQPFYF